MYSHGEFCDARWCAEKGCDGYEKSRLERPSAHDRVFSRATADTHLSRALLVIHCSRVAMRGAFKVHHNSPLQYLEPEITVPTKNAAGYKVGTPNVTVN